MLLRIGMMVRRACALTTFLAIALGASAVRAQGTDGVKPRWYFQTSLYTTHFNPDPRHVNQQRLLNFEHWTSENWVYGFSWQRNSFGQPTQYVYYGKIWRPFDSFPMMHVKLTGGLLHGYKGEFRDKIPLNKYGVAPGIVPSIGLSTKRFGGEIVFLGTAALMVTAGAFWD